MKLLRLIGRFSICSVVTANDRSPLCVWTSGASAVTLTVSAVPPDFERQRRYADAVAAADHDAGAPHGLERLQRDFDGIGVGRDVREHVVAVVVGERAWRRLVPRVSLISTTVAPGMTPPVESTTRPVTVPVVICARAEGGNRNKAATTQTTKLQMLRSIDTPFHGPASHTRRSCMRTAVSFAPMAALRSPPAGQNVTCASPN